MKEIRDTLINGLIFEPNIFSILFWIGIAIIIVGIVYIIFNTFKKSKF